VAGISGIGYPSYLQAQLMVSEREMGIGQPAFARLAV